jgi:SAM-dependent methyltransferase
MNSFLRATYQHLIPASLRARIRIGIDLIADRLQPGMPPRYLRAHISPLWLDFKATGRDQLQFNIELAGLQATDRVLDVACGCGRFALPLTSFLSPEGSYEGFDVFPEVVEWCRDHITVNHPNFRFSIADVVTPWSSGRTYTSGTYRFPYHAQQFDFVYAGSLFTHLTEEGARNYLNQVTLVLKPGGRFVCTWLLFNSESSKLLPGRSLAQLWDRDHGTHRSMGGHDPEASVLYDEMHVRSWYLDAGLQIVEPIRCDATYCLTRIPKDRSAGMNLYYAYCIIAIKCPELENSGVAPVKC